MGCLLPALVTVLFVTLSLAMAYRSTAALLPPGVPSWRLAVALAIGLVCGLSYVWTTK